MCELEHNHEEHQSCGKNCEHNHSHSDIKRVYLSVFLLIFAFFISENVIVKYSLYLLAYIISGFDIIFSALKNIIKGKVFDENFLMSLATLGAICLGEYPEAVSVMVLYQIGEFLQHRAVDKSRKSISALMDIRAEYANVEINGEVIRKNPDEVNIGDIIVVKAGEKVPLDGIVIDGNSFLDTSSLTGESILKEVKINDEVLSGVVNTDGLLKIRVEKEYKDSAVSKIIELVENASSRKSRAENFITKFARYYTPIVVLFALLLVIIPSLIYGFSNINVWINRALIFLVISCPCALVISVPLTFFSGIGAASKSGILIKGSNYLELLSKVGTVVFDKTGTLTKGVFKVTNILPSPGNNIDDVIKYAAYAEYYSNHPIALSIKNSYKENIDISIVKEVKEYAGNGVEAYIQGNYILVGNKKLMDKNAIKIDEKEHNGTIIYVAKNNKFIGSIIISDEIKDNAKYSIDILKKFNITPVILTGDCVNNARQIAEFLGINDYYAGLLPIDKVSKIENIIEKKKQNKSVVFVGDGINDAPVLMRSDIGIAMGALGSDAAIEAADVVIVDDNLSKIYMSMCIAKKTMSIVKQNIIFSIGIKVLFLILGTFGLMTMWGAIFADVGVTLIAVLNSLRTLKIKKYIN